MTATHKLFVLAGLSFIVSLLLLIVGNQDATVVNDGGLPEFKEEAELEPREEFVIEKVIRKQLEGVDMRSTLFLSNHLFFLESLEKINVTDEHENTLGLNEFCFKPHPAIFEKPSTFMPPFLTKLHVEMRYLSPCLITSPLNCFLDSHRVSTLIAHWNDTDEMDKLNDRLRGIYKAASTEPLRNSDVPYVKSEYGRELIEEYSKELRKLTMKNYTWYEQVEQWLQSIEPTRKICLDPLESCDDPTAVNYFRECSESNSELDCVKDRDKFIEQLRQSRQMSTLRALDPSVYAPDHVELVNEQCDGVFRDLKSEGVEVLRGARTFGRKFDEIHTEIFLMTPEMLFRSLKARDLARHGVSSWTLSSATQLLTEFRHKLREHVEYQNSLGVNQDYKITADVFSTSEFSEEHSEGVGMITVAVCTVLAVLSFTIMIFSVLIWSANWKRAILMFTLRVVFTVMIFLVFCHKDKVIVLNSDLMNFVVLHVIVNLFFTMRNAFCANRLHNSAQRLKSKENRSNFSSIATIISAKERRQLHYVLAQYTNFQTAQDTHLQDSFEQLTACWWILALIVLPVVVLYWYYVDATCHLMMAVIAPTVCAGAVEEWIIKNIYIDKRSAWRRRVCSMLTASTRMTTQESEEEIFSGQRHQNQNQSLAQKSQDQSARNLIKSTLRELNSDTYDSAVMKYPNEASRWLRLHTMRLYLTLLKLETLYGALICAFALLTAIFAVYVLFIPVQRVSIEYRTPHDELFIDVNWTTWDFEKNSEYLKNFTSKVDELIPSLRVASNWQKSFERFDENSTDFFAWKSAEPINSALTAQFAVVDYRVQRLRTPCTFRIRYDIEDSTNETIMKNIRAKLHYLISEHSRKDVSLTASGAVYAHFDEMAVAWNDYTVRELTAVALLSLLLIVFVFLFTTTPSIQSALTLAVFTTATRLEIAALCSVLSIDNHILFTNFALLCACIATWTPFCELCRFRSRVLAREKTRRTPELATSYRIRVPFIAAIDVVQFFTVVLIVLIAFTPFCCAIPRLRPFFVPTVLLIIIPFVAVLNAIAVSAATKLMFEQKVHITLCENLQGATTIVAQVHAFTHKIPRTPSYELEMGVIRPTEHELFFGPPPKYRKEPEDVEEEEEEIDVVTVSDDDEPGPSSRKRRLMDSDGVPVKRVECVFNGNPVDSTCFDARGQIVYADAINRAEELYEIDEEEEDELDVPLNLDPNALEIEREEEVEGLGGDDDDDDYDDNGVLLAGDSPPPQLDHRGIPQIVRRTVPRDPLREPPNILECIQANDRDLYPELSEVHPRAAQYPPEYSRAMVDYSEDPFWTRRTVALPEGIVPPPRPFDYYVIEPSAVPRENFEHVPAPGGLPIPPEAFVLREQRRRKFEEEWKKKEGRK